MAEREIKSIRKKFILISTLSFCAVMFLMGGLIYLFSTLVIRNEARQIMYQIAQNEGDLPLIRREADDDSSGAGTKQSEKSADVSGQDEDSSAAGRDEEDDQFDWTLRGIFGLDTLFGESPDYFYTTRYFSVLFDESLEVEDVKASHIAYIDETQAEEYGRYALKRLFHFGNFGRYYYYVADRENGGKIAIYIDRTTQVVFARRLLFAVLILLGFGTLLVFFLMRIFSVNIVRTEIENAEKQKQFITNASHELKTPLAVISANTEMQEMISGETEWTQSTLRQVERMNGLIQNLVKITKAQEMDAGVMTEQNIAPFIEETADSFAPVASGDGKKLIKKIDDPLIMKSDESKIRQLAALLTDNAVKYCDDGGTITIALAKSGKNALFTVTNTYAAGEKVDYSRFFERFYRKDEARTIQRESSSEGIETDGGTGTAGGYGIGLSIAESLVESMRGTIRVTWKNKEITFSCKLPLLK